MLRTAQPTDRVESAVRPCLHCGRDVPPSSVVAFCCAGCSAVYALLNEHGLNRYYDLRAKHSDRKDIPLPIFEEGSFAYLDDPAFKEAFAEQGGLLMRFHLEGVHCAACVWLTEKVPTLIPGVEWVRLDLSRALATVALKPGGSFAKVAEEFQRFGYRPHPIEVNCDDRRSKQDNRRYLLRMGVAAGASGNIMLLAIAVYAGASADFATVFRWVSAALYIPVLFFSAQPFFKGAWESLGRREIAMDVPIATGIAIGSSVSYIGLAMGGTEVYFDSLSGLIFLLLASRYFLKRVQARATDASHLLYFLTPSRANRREENGQFKTVRTEELRPGEEIEVRPGEIVPSDGIVLSGVSHVSQSWLTGESRGIRVGPDDSVLAGAFNESSPILVRVTAAGPATRLGEILRQTQAALGSRSSTMIIADQLAKIFVPATLLLIAVGFVFGARSGLHEGFLRAMAVAIVACPCALALAIPLTMSISIGKLARNGTLVRGADVLEKLSKVDTVFFDKTGTLTTGKLEVLDWIPSRSGLEAILIGLEAKSNHPIARAIRAHFPAKAGESLGFTDRKEILGRGVEGTLHGVRYALRSCESTEKHTEVALWEGERRIGTLFFGDRLRENTETAMGMLKRLGLRIGILSGDQRSVVSALAEKLRIGENLALSALSPEEKAEILKANPNALMVGDGVNDAIALASASVGIAVSGGMEASMRASGIYSASANPLEIPRLIVIARETMKVIRRNLAFTVLYNVVVISVALAGKLNPLFAAVVMPISAFTVFCLSSFGTRRLRRELREVST